jgi:hypothetical protein
MDVEQLWRTFCLSFSIVDGLRLSGGADLSYGSSASGSSKLKFAVLQYQIKPTVESGRWLPVERPYFLESGKTRARNGIP